MDYATNYQVKLCPVCATPYIDRLGDSCSGCGGDYEPVITYKTLAKAVTLLIKLGVGVLSTEMHQSSNSDVAIFLRGIVPEYIFDELPNNWRLLCHESFGGRSYQLYGISGKTKERIEQLEEWALSKDIDGFRAVLKLSGYEVGR